MAFRASKELSLQSLLDHEVLEKRHVPVHLAGTTHIDCSADVAEREFGRRGECGRVDVVVQPSLQTSAGDRRNSGGVGWQVGGIITAQSGVPATLGSSAASTTRIPKPDMTGRTTCRARALPPRTKAQAGGGTTPPSLKAPFGSFGNVGRDTALAPGFSLSTPKYTKTGSCPTRTATRFSSVQRLSMRSIIRIFIHLIRTFWREQHFLARRRPPPTRVSA